MIARPHFKHKMNFVFTLTVCVSLQQPTVQSRKWVKWSRHKRTIFHKGQSSSLCHFITWFCFAVCMIFGCLFREGVEPPESHLTDMLQQLTTVNNARPSERTLIRQGRFLLSKVCRPLSTSAVFIIHVKCYDLLINSAPFILNRGGRGPSMHSCLLDQQVGRLLR